MIKPSILKKIKTWIRWKRDKIDISPTPHERTTYQHVVVQHIKPKTHRMRVYKSDQGAYMTKERIFPVETLYPKRKMIKCTDTGVI